MGAKEYESKRRLAIDLIAGATKINATWVPLEAQIPDQRPEGYVAR